MIFAWSGLWSLAAHYGTFGLLLLACAAVAYFLPPLRKDAIWAAVVIIAGMVLYSLGVRDEGKFCKAQNQAVVAAGERARSSAVEQVEHPRRRPWPFGVRNDPDCRDCTKH